MKNYVFIIGEASAIPEYGIVDTDEKVRFEDGFEKLMEDLSNKIPDFYDEQFGFSLYIGASSFFSIDVLLDHKCLDDETLSKAQDKLIDLIHDFLNKETACYTKKEFNKAYPEYEPEYNSF